MATLIREVLSGLRSLGCQKFFRNIISCTLAVTQVKYFAFSLSIALVCCSVFASYMFLFSLLLATGSLPEESLAPFSSRPCCMVCNPLDSSVRFLSGMMLPDHLHLGRFSNSQLSTWLTSCGDVEPNPGPWKLSVLQWNMNGWSQHFGDLQALIKAHQPDVILLQETHLKPAGSSSSPLPIKVPGYHITRCDRSIERSESGRTGGGVMTLVRSSCDVSSWLFIENHWNHEWHPPPKDLTDCCQVHLTLGDSRIPITFSNVYARPGGGAYFGRAPNRPDYPPFSADRTLSSLTSSPGPHVIAGDFNAHHPMWEASDDSDNRGDDIAVWCSSHTFWVANDRISPTYVPVGRPLSSSPDLSLLSPGVSLLSWSTLPSNHGSDHAPILFQVLVGPPGSASPRLPKRPPMSYCFKKADWTKFNLAAEAHLVAHRSRARTLAGLASTLVSAILVGAKQLPRGARRQPVSWWDKEVTASVEARAAAEAAARRDPSAREAYTSAVAHTAALMRAKKRDHWRKFASTLSYHTHPSLTAKVLKGVGNDSRPPPSLAIKSRSGRMLATDQEKADGFAAVFGAAMTPDAYDPACSILRELRMRPSAAAVRKARVNTHRQCEKKDFTPYHWPVSMSELDLAINRLPSRSAPGADGIHTIMLKNLSPPLREELRRLINLSLQRRQVPTEWLSGIVVPIPKAGKDPGIAENFRPVQLLSCIAKVAEHVIAYRLRHFLEQQHSLCDEQSGFRAGRSTEDCLLRLIGEIASARLSSSNSKAAVVSLDLKSAFDRVPHSLLLQSMMERNVPPVLCGWYRSFLAHRRYNVRVGSALSRTRYAPFGVPQGSVSGPLLFIVFLDSLLQELRSAPSHPLVSHTAFADDVTLWSSGPTREALSHNLSPAMGIVHRWAITHRMTFSVGKCQCLFITGDKRDRFSTPSPSPPPSPHPPGMRPITHYFPPTSDVSLPDSLSEESDRGILTITLGSSPIKQVSHLRVLGCWLDGGLTFEHHCNFTVRKALRRYGQLCAMASSDWGCSPADLRCMYISYIRSVMEYMAAVWAPHLSAKCAHLLVTVQNKCARVITGCIRSTDTTSLLLEANLQPIMERLHLRAVVAYERACRLPLHDPLNRLVRLPLPPHPRLKKFTYWRLLVARLYKQWKWHYPGEGTPASADHRLLQDPQPSLLVSPCLPTDARLVPRVDFNPNVLPVLPSESALPTSEQRRLTSLRALERWSSSCQWQTFTDGSAPDKVGAAGFACFREPTPGPGAEDFPIFTQVVACGTLCDPFQAEAGGILALLDFISLQSALFARPPTTPTDLPWNLLIATDGQSVIRFLQSGPAERRHPTCSHIWSRLIALVRPPLHGLPLFDKIIFQFVYSHVGVRRNVFVDELITAKTPTVQPHLATCRTALPCIIAEAASLLRAANRQECISASSGSFRSLVCPSRSFMSSVSMQLSDLSRQQYCSVARLRVGHSPLIGQGSFCFDRNLHILHCRWCRDTKETVAHVLLECRDPRVSSARSRLSDKSALCLDPDRDTVPVLVFISECLASLSDEERDNPFLSQRLPRIAPPLPFSPPASPPSLPCVGEASEGPSFLSLQSPSSDSSLSASSSPSSTSSSSSPISGQRSLRPPPPWGGGLGPPVRLGGGLGPPVRLGISPRSAPPTRLLGPAVRVGGPILLADVTAARRPRGRPPLVRPPAPPSRRPRGRPPLLRSSGTPDSTATSGGPMSVGRPRVALHPKAPPMAVIPSFFSAQGESSHHALG